jgi:predicted HicB family RNase H-like nuclease
VGRQKLPKGEAKGRIVPVRFNADDLRAIEAAAKVKKLTLSEWIRSTLNAAIER